MCRGVGREIPSSPCPPAAAPWINKHASLHISQPVGSRGLIKKLPPPFLRGPAPLSVQINKLMNSSRWTGLHSRRTVPCPVLPIQRWSRVTTNARGDDHQPEQGCGIHSARFQQEHVLHLLPSNPKSHRPHLLVKECWSEELARTQALTTVAH